MKSRLPTVLSATALALGVLGVTPVGNAAQHLILPPHSVGARELKDDAVVTSKVKDHSLLAQDFRQGQLPAGPAGPQGKQGFQGAQGPQGSRGAQGLKGDKGEKGDKGSDGQDGSNATKFWAVVRSDGTVADSSGVTGSYHDGPGEYRIQFNYDLSHCALLATPVSTGYRVGVQVYAPNPTMASVFSRALDNSFQDAYFNLGAFC